MFGRASQALFLPLLLASPVFAGEPIAAVTAEPSPEMPSRLADLLAEGRRYAEFRQFDLAYPYLRKAVELNPIDIQAQTALGSALIEDVETDLLSQARLKSLQSAPAGNTPSVSSVKLNDAQALGKALSLVDLSPELAAKLTDGEQNILVALKITGNEDREALGWMGQIHFLRKDWVQARRRFTGVIRGNTADIEAGRWLKETEYQATLQRLRERDEAERKAKAEAEAKDKKKNKKKKQAKT